MPGKGQQVFKESERGMSAFLFITGIVIGAFITYKLLQNRLEKEEQNRKKYSGKLTEKFIPFLDRFDYAPSDTIFLGMPIDFIVFDGLSDGYVKDIIIIEAKTNSSKLSQRQKQIMDAVKHKRIKWVEFRL